MKIMNSMFIFLLAVLFICIDANADRGISLRKIHYDYRTALIIGNGNYKTEPLKNPPNDAKDMAKILKKSGFDVSLKINVSQREMESAIRSFGKKLRQGGTGLFYYAGHGVQVNGRNYLIPISSTIESEADVKYEAVDAGLILDKMEDADNRVNIVILDACRSNPFTRSFRSAEQGLARMDAPKGSLIAYATAPGSVAVDGEDGNGVFTKFLIENIQKPNLTIEQVLKLVRVAVADETSNKQIPWESSSLMGDFFFNSDGENIRGQVPPSISSANTISDEEEMWLLVKKSESISELKTFLSSFPNGRFEAHAKLILKRLESSESKNIDTSKPTVPKMDEKKIVVPPQIKTLKYDDGSSEISVSPWSEQVGSEIAVRFTPEFYPTKINSVKFYVADRQNYDTEFEVKIYASKSENPAHQLNHHKIILKSSEGDSWAEADISDQNLVIDEGDFFVSMYWLTPPGSNGKDAQMLGFDKDDPFSRRTYKKYGKYGSWQRPTKGENRGAGNAMIRVAFF